MATKYNHKAHTITKLKKAGFVRVNDYESLFINAKGEALNGETGKYYKPNRRNYISIEGKKQSLPKLILSTFAGEPIRNGEITYLDRNRGNLSATNLKYSRMFEPKSKSDVNHSDLMTAIRCYFQVQKDYKTKNWFLTKHYLNEIIEHRCFYLCHAKGENIEVLKEYFSGYNKTNETTAKRLKMAVRDVNIIVNQYLKLIIAEILQDMNTGILKIKEYSPKPPTQTEKIKAMNAKLIKNGLQPLPLRKLSLKEKIKKYHERNRKLLTQPEG